jgi:hypothetical protein
MIAFSGGRENGFTSTVAEPSYTFQVRVVVTDRRKHHGTDQDLVMLEILTVLSNQKRKKTGFVGRQKCQTSNINCKFKSAACSIPLSTSLSNICHTQRDTPAHTETQLASGPRSQSARNRYIERLFAWQT